MAKEKRTSSIDMTSGSPYRLIISFTLPMLLGNIFQQLYNMVDSIVVGNVIGDQALAGVGTGFPISTCSAHCLWASAPAPPS